MMSALAESSLTLVVPAGSVNVVYAEIVVISCSVLPLSSSMVMLNGTSLLPMSKV